ncbi:23S rRNA pseudouridine(2604) synthase RluF [Ketobacter sp. MCCC 1A13808]|nr:23S rRNA pseudouridine(2604) synthase RluF [Ketobacter sp. MCCC 1A13808]
MTSGDGIRLNKFISDSGYCSRREADAHIGEGAVTVNGSVAGLGTRVMPGDTVKVGWQKIKNVPDNKSDRVYIAYNKPVGITCTTDQNVAGNIIDAVRHKERVFPVGRLDNPSEGLIFLTSDGDIVNKILRVGNAHEKEYVVTVNKPISGQFVEKMSSGIPILGTRTKPCKVVMQSALSFKIILTQGLNRQIRRMCEYLGYEVVKLKRVRIMSVKLGTLKSGQWRNLTDKEMAGIREAIATSDNSAAASPGKKVRAGGSKARVKKPSKGNTPGKSLSAKSTTGKSDSTKAAKGKSRSGKTSGKFVTRNSGAGKSTSPRKSGRGKPGSRK